MSTAERLVPVLIEALKDTEFILDGVSVTPAGRRSVVRVVIDRNLGDVRVVTQPSAPLSLDDVAAATRLVSTSLDADDLLGSAPYTLEVTSPGVSRPLTTARHYQRNIGRLVRVLGPATDLTGRLMEADQVSIVLTPARADSVPASQIRVPLQDLSRGEVQIEFNRPGAEPDPMDLAFGPEAEDRDGH